MANDELLQNLKKFTGNCRCKVCEGTGPLGFDEAC